MKQSKKKVFMSLFFIICCLIFIFNYFFFKSSIRSNINFFIIKYKLTTISNIKNEKETFKEINNLMIRTHLWLSFYDKNGQIVKPQICGHWNRVKSVAFCLEGKNDIFYELKSNQNLGQLLGE
ncbi:hypothetical protein AAEX28_15480 [Lentisphaerota bacterium WC36G]|nr:hypothetical protein LJT99_02235 [Lentisphaerae bacterium WC36]